MEKSLYYFYSVILLLTVSILIVSFASAGLVDWFNKITGRATSQTTVVNITITNRAPNITFVTNVSIDRTINPAEYTFVNITFNFTAWDADGAINLNETTARANFTGSGLPVRQNLTCIRINTYGDPVNYANFTCIIHMWYFDPAGVWNISAAINDTSNSVAINSTFNFTYNTLTAFKMSPSTVTFAAINPGATNTTSNNDPILLNNTGNVNIAAGAIEVNATDLLGETDNTRGMYAGNITIANNTLPANAECDFTGNNNASLMLTSKFSVVNLTSLSRGNTSVNDGSTGQEQLYFCILKAGNELTAQSYSTDNKGTWTIKIA